MIEGLTPQDRPFLTAKKITVEVPWWTVFSRKLDHRVGRHDRLEHGGRDISQRPPQLPKFTREDAEQGTEPLHDDAPECGRLAGLVHVRGSRDALEHLRARLERADFSPAGCDQLPRARVVLGRHSEDPVVRVVPHEHAVEVHDRWSYRALRPHGFDRRRIPVGRHRRRRLGALAGADLSGALENRLSRRRKRSSFTARSSRPPARAISPARFISSRAAAS